MSTLIGTELSLASLLEDFQRVEVEALEACHAARAHLHGTLPQMCVAGLERLHEHQLERLWAMARSGGAGRPGEGTDHEARTVGHIHHADATGGDDAVLAAVDEAETDAVAAYERALESTTLPASLKPAFEVALKDLRRARNRLEATARTIA